MDFTNVDPKMGCVVRGRAPVTSLSYHSSGSNLFVASEKDSILRVVDCLNGNTSNNNIVIGGGGEYNNKMIRLQNQGIRIVKSTHHTHCVLFTPGSNCGVPMKNDVHYLSVHDNKILRKFEGHSGVITSMSMSPVDDTFLTSCVDGTVKLWDCGKSGNSLAEMKLPDIVEGSPLAAFDSTGLVFGITGVMRGGEGYVSFIFVPLHIDMCLSHFLLWTINIDFLHDLFFLAYSFVRCSELFRGTILRDENNTTGR